MIEFRERMREELQLDLKVQTNLEAVAQGVTLNTLVQGAWAQGPGAVRKQVEASMRVTGMLTIRTDGSVAAVELDTPERLPEGIPAFVSGVAASWRFEPVIIGGAAKQVRTRMSAHLVAKSTGDGQMLVSVRGADFGDYEAIPPEERVSSVNMKPPGYPMAAARAGAAPTATPATAASNFRAALLPSAISASARPAGRATAPCSTRAAPTRWPAARARCTPARATPRA